MKNIREQLSRYAHLNTPQTTNGDNTPPSQLPLLSRRKAVKLIGSGLGAAVVSVLTGCSLYSRRFSRF